MNLLKSSDRATNTLSTPEQRREKREDVFVSFAIAISKNINPAEEAKLGYYYDEIPHDKMGGDDRLHAGRLSRATSLRQRLHRSCEGENG